MNKERAELLKKLEKEVDRIDNFLTPIEKKLGIRR